MRRPTDDEYRLIEASRKARDHQERAEARNKMIRRVALMAFAGLFLILAGVTVWAWHAQATATREAAEVLTQSGINVLEQGHLFEAIHLFAQAIVTLSSEARAQADNPLRLSSLGPGHVPVLRSILGQAEPVRSAAFSPDGKRVVTASLDASARVWNAENGKPAAELKGHAGPVNSAAFSPDGKQVVTASGDGTARVWPLEPLNVDAKAISLWVQAYTGTELQGGTIRPLSDAEWKTHCRTLRAYGTKAPPSPWLEGRDLAERPARP
jgi:hypothetical protein